MPVPDPLYLRQFHVEENDPSALSSEESDRQSPNFCRTPPSPAQHVYESIRSPPPYIHPRSSLSRPMERPLASDPMQIPTTVPVPSPLLHRPFFVDDNLRNVFESMPHMPSGRHTYKIPEIAYAVEKYLHTYSHSLCHPRLPDFYSCVGSPLATALQIDHFHRMQLPQLITPCFLPTIDLLTLSQIDDITEQLRLLLDLSRSVLSPFPSSLQSHVSSQYEQPRRLSSPTDRIPTPVIPRPLQRIRAYHNRNRDPDQLLSPILERPVARFAAQL
jgi:hypothetical protein